MELAPATTIELSDANLRLALSLVGKLRSVKSAQQAQKLADSIPGAVFANDFITLPIGAFLGCDTPETRVTYRVVQPNPACTVSDADAEAAAEADDDTATETDDSDSESESDDQSGTPLSRARGVFQSRAVTDTLIAAAGPKLHAINAALNAALVEKNLASKRRRTQLHEMPDPTDAAGVVRRKLALVAQQAIGAVWTLARGSVGPRQAAENDVMQAHATTLADDAQAVFTLPHSKDIFAKYIDTSSTARLRECFICRTMGCRECRKLTPTPTGDAPTPTATDDDSML